MPHQDTSPKALRDQLRAQRAHPHLRLALAFAYLVTLITAFVRSFELVPNDPLLRALFCAAIALSSTTILLCGAMLVDLIDALLRIHTTPPTAPNTDATPAPLSRAPAQLRADSAYKPLRALLLLCYLASVLASIPLAISTLFSVIAGGLVAYLTTCAVIDLADALLLAQSRIAQATPDA